MYGTYAIEIIPVVHVLLTLRTLIPSQQIAQAIHQKYPNGITPVVYVLQVLYKSMSSQLTLQDTVKQTMQTMH